MGRLESVIAFLGSEQCLTTRLLDYFGEVDAEVCGQCSVCLGKGAALPERSSPELSLEDVELIQTLIAERQAALRSGRQLARFLCGIASPASTGARLKRHRGFGIFANLPFLEVLAAVKALGKNKI